MKVYFFPGQGSQNKGMGESLFDTYGEITGFADKILGYSIEKLCNEDEDGLLNRTKYTQPALYTINCLKYLELKEKDPVLPDHVAGHSLGEYSALFAAGVFDFETGLKMVVKRGELMDQAKGGGMAAVIGITPELVNEIISSNSLDSISIANLNSPLQTVIGGLKEDIDDAKDYFTSKKAMFIPLKVSGAFHTKHMDIARDEFAEYIDGFEFSKSKIPVISNYTGLPYNEDIKTNLVKQLTNPVKWTDSILYLMEKGEFDFVEVGPGKVLTGLMKRIKKEASYK
ncbi:MAG: ACP S-malonyltransferase [Deltaproteobacteria bacterium]|nr:ACP S-malonyltransferase [Deltaproteobacteria bacterium]